MKVSRMLIILILTLFVSGLSFAASLEPLSADPGWPRVIEKNGNQLIIYQPQVDAWIDYKKLKFRFAFSVKTASAKEEKFGVAEAEAETETDHENRSVAVMTRKRELRFPNIPEKEADELRRIVDNLQPPVKDLTISLDRILPYLDPEQQSQQHAVELNLDPPKIFHSQKPAILVIFIGEPQLQPVVKEKNELMFAVNTNWDVFYETTEKQYYLLDGDSWMTTMDAVKGPWTPATNLPTGLSSLPEDDNWSDVRKHIPGLEEKNPPAVFVATEPAEMILTDGAPNYSPIPNTKLLRVTNSDSIVFLHSGDNNHYFLAAGRWFRSESLEGPWKSASSDLPSDFIQIPDDDPAASVKASVPGTTEAKDAILLASVPTNIEVDLANSTVVQVNYIGEPKFEPITSTTVQYAVNSPNAVFLVEGRYYCCDQGVWFVSSTATGPWTYSTKVPQAIYAIPSTHPLHNVTYVVVETTTPTTVVYTQTAGYSAEYVASTGVLMFGAGMIVGAIIADHHDYYYYPWYSAHYSYGCSARYSYAHGGYYRGAHVSYGPYGGAGATAAYNPRTGTYTRGAYAYGPAGTASVRQAYNPYTGTRAQSGRVNTAYGSAGRGAAYNPYSGTAVRGGYRSSDYGTAAGVQTNRGSGAVAWDTNQGQGAVAKDRQGNVYAGKDGNVYRKSDSGAWSTNTGSGWQATDNRLPTHDLQSQSQSRNRGNQLSQSSRTANRSNFSGGGRRGGGRR